MKSSTLNNKINPSTPLRSELKRPQTEDILDRALRGVLWTSVSLAGSKLLAFSSIVILTRLLIPAEFGQVGFALVVIGYVDAIGGLGISEALIYEQKRGKEAANIAFLINLSTGVLWFVLIWSMAPMLAAFFKDSTSEPIFRAMAWVFPISALGHTHDALLRRTMAFKKRLIPDFTRALMKAFFSVVLAGFGWGVWSLVWGHLIGAATATLGLWIVSPFRPRWKCPWDLVRRMLRYGGHIVSVNMLAVITHHADYLVVGRVLGSAALGFYMLGYRLPELVIIMLIWVVGKVTFPAYTKLQNDPLALQGALLVTLRYISLVTLPSGIGLAVLARVIVPSVFGGIWEPSVSVLQALAISCIFRSLASNAGDIYKAIGRPDILTKLGLGRAVVIVPALLFGASFGIAGVAVTQMIVTGASTLVTLFIASKILSVPLKSIVAEFKPAMLSSATMVIGLYVLLPNLSNWSDVPTLILAVVFGVGVYTLAVWHISRDTALQARAAIMSSFGKTT